MQNFITYKNAKIFYTDVGKGTAVVLLHGFLENAQMWQNILPELKKNNRIITVDLLGHGKSDCLGYVHSMELFAAAIEAVLKHLKLRKYILVGHSLGGYISLALAKMNPTKVKGLCLLNSTSTKDSKERKKIRNRAIEMAQKNYVPLVQMSISNLFHKENITPFKAEIKRLKEEALTTSLQGYIAAQEGMKIRENYTPFLTEANFKKLFIIGEKDPVIPSKSLIAEAKETNAAMVVLSGGHMSYIENKTELIAVLKAFIKA